MSDQHFKFEKGTLILVDDRAWMLPICGIITGCFAELGKNVYDYVDCFGNPHWCYEEQLMDCILNHLLKYPNIIV